MKYPFSERTTTLLSIVAGLALFFHPHLGPQPITRAADCSEGDGSVRNLTLTAASRRQYRWLRLCDTLNIVNADTTSFYPAPGPHPHHASYPELDPRRPLDPGETYAIRLTRPGNYQLHNDTTEKILADLTIIGWVR